MLLDEAIFLASEQAQRFRDHRPTLGTLLEEVAELARSLEGKHTDHPGLELVQIASIALNMLSAYPYVDVHRAITRRNML